MSHSSSNTHDCAECPLHDLSHDPSHGPPQTRLDFLKQVSVTLFGTALALGAATRDAKAFAVRTGHALLVRGDEATYDIPVSDGATIDKDNQVILVRDGAQAYAFALSCPHQNTALRWMADEHIFQCPKHKSTYKPDGTFISGRATRGMDRLAIRKQDTHLIVSLDVVYEQDKDGKAWNAATVTVA